MKISVAMATFNGEKFLEEQIHSILPQLRKTDELIISDDGSIDHTMDIVHSMQSDDSRIKSFYGPRKGVMKNFENAIIHCSGDIVVLSDQDDVWTDNKIQIIENAFFTNPDVTVILHSKYDFYENNEKGITTSGEYYSGIIRNIMRSCYWGCCMAFKREFIIPYLPFPKWGIAHDQLIGLLSESTGSTLYINSPLVFHRYHDNNATQKGTLYEKISFRIKLIGEFFLCKVKKNARELFF